MALSRGDKVGPYVIAAALGAEGKGIVHRDLKPGKVFMAAKGHVKEP